MVGACGVSWLLVTLVAPVPVNPELLLGMVAPLASAVATWIVTARTQAADPARVTGVLVAGFGFKLVFFGVYMALMLRVVEVRTVPFAAAFTGYIIGLYVMEALFLKRLFVGGARSSSAA
jgi:hypothetical protein